MKLDFPILPDYQYSWRSIQVEPIPFSGERITIGAIVKGSDSALIAAKLIPATKLKSIYGQEFGSRISDALSICVKSAEEFYQNKSLSSKWIPPLDGFYLSKETSSLAQDIEEGLLAAAMHCSSFSVSLKNINDKKTTSAPEYWRKNIFRHVTVERADFEHCFEKSIQIRGSGVPITFGFMSANYVAQFDAFTDSKTFQQGLVRAQSKLWQLDRLRDEGSLFTPELCELMLNIPMKNNIDDESSMLVDFVEELKYEASRRDLSIYTSGSPEAAAKHLIEKAA